MVGRLLSFWDGLFSWAMLVLGSVDALKQWFLLKDGTPTKSQQSGRTQEGPSSFLVKNIPITWMARTMSWISIPKKDPIRESKMDDLWVFHAKVSHKSQENIRFPWWNAIPSLKLAFSPLKIDGWKMILSFWVSAYFQGQTVSFRVCKRHFFWCQMGWHHQLCSNLPIQRRDRQTLKVQYTLAVTRHVNAIPSDTFGRLICYYI